MALRWYDGFDELPDVNEETYLTSAGYLFASDTDWVTGRGDKGRAVRLSNSNASLQRAVGAASELIVGMGFKYTSTLVVDDVIMFGTDTGVAIETGIRIERNLSNGLQLIVNGVLTGSTPQNVIQANVFAYIETRIVLNGVASVWQCRINNQQVADVTFDGTGIAMDRVLWDKRSNGSHIIDDVYVLDNLGTANVTWLGDVFVENIALQSNASPIQFTPVGSVANFSNINEIGAADELKYNVSQTVGARDMFNIANLNILVDQVFAVMVGLRVRKIGSGSVTVNSVLNDGVNPDQLGPEFSPDTDFQTVFDIFSEKPSGGAWTIEDFNSLIIGYEIAS